MGRTKATLIYRRTKNPRAVQLLPGFTKLDSTVRHLGIEVGDAAEISERTELWSSRHRRHLTAGQALPMGVARSAAERWQRELLANHDEPIRLVAVRLCPTIENVGHAALESASILRSVF